MNIFRKNKVSDKNQLLSLMQSASEGNFILCNEKNFKDKKLAHAYNDLIYKFLQSNNQTAMELNQSMNTIGNCSHVRTMLEIVEAQKNKLNTIATTGKSLSESISESEQILHTINKDVASAYETSMLSKKAMEETITNVNQSYQAILQADLAINGFSEKSVAIKKILSIVSNIAERTQILALNARIEASRSTDGKGFSIVANEIGNLSVDTQESVKQMEEFIHEILTDIQQLVEQFDSLKDVLEISSNFAHETEQSVQKMAENMQHVMEQISSLYLQINTQNTDTKSFTEHTIMIAKDADLLSTHCKQPGKDMYTISRAIDKIRTRIIRSQSSLSQNELLDVYNTDHLIFTGRLYNMIEGFEELKLKNLNQPEKCKFGIWMQKLKNKQPALAASFQQANLFHTRLHELATACFYANESGEKEQALQLFEQAQNIYQNFSGELNRLKMGGIGSEGNVDGKVTAV